MKIGQIILFEITDDYGLLNAKGQVLRGHVEGCFTVLVTDVSIGNSERIGEEIDVYPDEVYFKGTEQHLTTYKPRKLKYHANEYKSD